MLLLKKFSLATAQEGVLLQNCDAILGENHRVGLVGRNGCGKSTFLSCLSNAGADADSHFDVTSGEVAFGKSVSREHVLLVRQDKLKWSDLFTEVESEEIATQSTIQELLDLEMHDTAAEEDEEWRRLVLERGWGGLDVPIAELSPGSALRAFIALSLIRVNIKVLLLDEITNHLDMETILWVEGALKKSGKAMIVVSHDETFLDSIVDHVWEVEEQKTSGAKLVVHKSSFSAWKEAKRLAIQHQKELFCQQQAEHDKLSAVAERLKLASARGAFGDHTQDKDKLQRDFFRERASRSGKKSAVVTRKMENMDRVEKVHERSPLKINLDSVPRCGVDSSLLLDCVIMPRGCRVPLTLRVDFGERVAILGRNGVGKSSLLHVLLGELEPVSGTVSVGRDLRVGNMMQMHDSLPRNETPRKFVAAQTGLDEFKAGSRIIRFGLTLHQVDQPIAELNPGARARLILALFSMRQLNTLVLDEVANHLDAEARKEVLGTLQSFEGTIVIVSHDRAFLSEMQLTRVLVLSQEGMQEVESVAKYAQAFS